MQSYDTLDTYWQEIHNIPQLSIEEEQKLSEQIQAGNERAVEKLVTANLRFVVSLARQYADKGVNMTDLISEGNIALMMEARKWKPKDGERFVNHAVWAVRKAMEAAIPELGPMITLPKQGGIDEAKKMKQYSTEMPMHPGQTNTVGDMLKAGKPMTDDEAETNEISYGLARAIHYLNEREKNVIMSYYGLGGRDHLTMAEIGEEHGFTRERVRQIRKTAERKMRREMRKLKS